MSDVASKTEVLKSLSTQLRRDDVPDLTWIKLLDLYAKLSGWVFPLTPTPSKGVVKKASPLDLVLEEERKRRADG